VDVVRREKPEPAMAVLVVVPAEEVHAGVRPCSMAPKRSGTSGRHFIVLNWDSENGLSFETWGREWLLGRRMSPSVTPSTYGSVRSRRPLAARDIEVAVFPWRGEKLARSTLQKLLQEWKTSPRRP
jgi:hypothetical protein